MRQKELERALGSAIQVAQGFHLKLAKRLVDWTPGSGSDPFYRQVYYLDLFPATDDFSNVRALSSRGLGWRTQVDVPWPSGEGEIYVWELTTAPHNSPWRPLDPIAVPDIAFPEWFELWVRSVDAARRLAGTWGRFA